ncbi:MAG TPA: hypothetical protein VFC78_13885 [Tepidisphaeraceae bacterium]|nr:hypothetical protein [Tepidisphaeraceae bacterium]
MFRIAIIIPACIFAASCATPPSAHPSEEAILFSKRTPNESRIEVVRGGPLPLGVCRAAISPQSFEGASAIYPVRLQIRPPNGPPIVLWSRIKSHYGIPANDGIDVLDMAIYPDKIVVVTAEDQGISVWFISFYMGDSPRAALKSSDWTGSSTGSFVNHENVTASIGTTADGKRVKVIVTQRGQAENCRTVYEQSFESGWPMNPEFKIVSQSPARAMPPIPGPATGNGPADPGLNANPGGASPASN